MGAQFVEEEALTTKQAAEVELDAVTVLSEMEAHVEESSASTSRENGDEEGINKSNIPPKTSCEKKKKEKKGRKKSSKDKEKKRKKKKKSSSKSKEKQEETLSGLMALDKSRDEEEDDEDWLPCPQMEEDDDSEYSDFASCETSATPGWGSPQPQASPRKAQSVSHYTMKAFTTSTPATRISHSRFPVLTLPLTPLSATIATTKEHHHVCPNIVSPRRDKASRNLNMITRLSTDHDDHNSDNDSGGMTVVAPRQRRLSLWSKASTDNQDEIQTNSRQRSKRRHSIDGSMHKSTMPTLRKTRRRLSFFLDKSNKEIKSNRIDDDVDDDKATPKPKDCATQTEENSSTKHTRCKTTVRRRHSFDCSAHKTSTPEHAPASPRRRRRLSFFGDTKDKDTTGTSRKKSKTKRNKKSKKEAGSDNAPSSSRQPRRLSFFGDRNEITNDPKPKNNKLSFRRHSIDGSMHQSNHNTMRRRLSFFGNKTETTTESASDSLNAPMDAHQECKISLFPLFKRRLSLFGNNNKPETPKKEPLRNSNVLMIQLARNRGRRLSIFGGNKKDVDDSVVCQPKCLNENSGDICRRHSYNTCHHTTLKPPAKDTPIVSAKKSRRRHSIDGSMHRSPPPPDSPSRRRRRLGSSVAAIPTEYVIPTNKLTTKNKKIGKSKEMHRRHSIDGSMHDLKVRDDEVVHPGVSSVVTLLMGACIKHNTSLDEIGFALNTINPSTPPFHVRSTNMD